MNRRVKILLPILLFIFLMINTGQSVHAQTPSNESEINIYFFWGDGCSHCAKAKSFLESLVAGYDHVTLRSYEVYHDANNRELYSKMAAKFGITQMAVPGIFIGSRSFIGYSEEIAGEIKSTVDQCLLNGCEDAGTGIEGLEPTKSPSPSPVNDTPTVAGCGEGADSSDNLGSCQVNYDSMTKSPTLSSTPDPAMISTSLPPVEKLTLPILGSINLSHQSVTVSTILIALVDGINPCSLWVLSVLLALTLHTGSRKKVVVIGLVFLTVTAGIYALFIAGLFNILKITRFLGWVQVLVGLLTLGFAIINIKDYFWFKEGLSLTIADEKKPGVFRMMRRVVDASQSFWGMIGATIALAAGVSLVEFSCTAGFPVLWTNIIVDQNVTGVSFLFLLLLYMVIYQFDEMLIFFTSVITLKTSKLEEKHGRLLKLISGMLMLSLSIVMLVKPELMNDLSSSLIIFGLALLATLCVLLLHRVILPKFGVFIGINNSKKR